MTNDDNNTEPLTIEMRKDFADWVVMEANAFEGGIFYLAIVFFALCTYSQNVMGAIFFGISIVLVHIIRKLNIESITYTLQENRKSSCRLDRINSMIDWISIASFAAGMLFIILNLGAKL